MSVHSINADDWDLLRDALQLLGQTEPRRKSDADSLQARLHAEIGQQSYDGGGPFVAIAAYGTGPTVGMSVDYVDERDHSGPFEVIFVRPGEKRLDVMKVLRERRGLTLLQAKAIVDDRFVVIANDLSAVDSYGLRDSLAAVGAEVEVRGVRQRS